MFGWIFNFFYYYKKFWLLLFVYVCFFCFVLLWFFGGYFVLGFFGVFCFLFLGGGGVFWENQLRERERMKEGEKVM